jgi:predicted nucleotidyltransferase
MSDLLERWRYEAKTKLPELLDEVANSIKQVHQNCTVILFGSYARGEQHEDSDLDICVLVPELTYNRVNMRIAARCAIRNDFPLPIDVLLYTYDEFEESAKKKSRMQCQIKNEGVVLGGGL